MLTPLTTKTLKEVFADQNEADPGEEAFAFRCKQHPESLTDTSYSFKHEAILTICGTCDHPIVMVKVADHPTNWKDVPVIELDEEEIEPDEETEEDEDYSDEDEEDDD